MLGVPDGFPGALIPAVPADMSAAERALIAAPNLEPFWKALAEHVPKLEAQWRKRRDAAAEHVPDLEAQGWERRDAAAVLVGAVLLPLAMGYDAHGTLARKVRDGVRMDRRTKAADLAHELAKLLDIISCEPLPPDAVVGVVALLDQRLIARDAPSYFMSEPTAKLLRRLRDALREPPDYSEAPGLASQKPSWRGFIREARSNLDKYGFALRERDTIALAAVICADAGVMKPSRDSVRAALRWGDLDQENPSK